VTTLADLPMHDGQESPATLNGAKGRKAARNPNPDPAASRRGRTSLRAGKDAERAIARAYGGKRTGMYGGPDDVVVGDLFIVQSKAGGWFSERVWAELEKLPRTGGRIPTLVVSERPPSGRHARRYVVRMMADDLDLHGPSGDAA
jgi:hypothetical protein